MSIIILLTTETCPPHRILMISDQCSNTNEARNCEVVIFSGLTTLHWLFQCFHPSSSYVV